MNWLDLAILWTLFCRLNFIRFKFISFHSFDFSIFQLSLAFLRIFISSIKIFFSSDPTFFYKLLLNHFTSLKMKWKSFKTMSKWAKVIEIIEMLRSNLLNESLIWNAFKSQIDYRESVLENAKTVKEGKKIVNFRR